MTKNGTSQKDLTKLAADMEAKGYRFDHVDQNTGEAVFREIYPGAAADAARQKGTSR